LIFTSTKIHLRQTLLQVVTTRPLSRNNEIHTVEVVTRDSHVRVNLFRR
jgi:hypothetical protein